MAPRLKPINIYENKQWVKYLILAVAFTIANVSIVYTNWLVRELADREKKLIELSAEAYRAVTDIDLNSDQNQLLFHVIESNDNIPVILTDEDGNYLSHRNLGVADSLKGEALEELIQEELAIMRQEYQPIIIEIPGLKQYIYYRNSNLISQLKWYPVVMMLVISLFGVLAYLAFSVSRRSEQDRVWVGLAKETAHQLGTPLSSLMAWTEYFKTDPDFRNKEIIGELEKDISRLQMVTARFSNIGSMPTLKPELVDEAIASTVNYLQRRVSSKVTIKLHAVQPSNYLALINLPLFDWVIENLCKNAVDAMAGAGRIDIVLQRTADARLVIDVTDTGKGIPKNQIKQVFEPGFTTKKRGWGLGLTLVKRIVEEYHKGRIFVKQSKPGKGTTFRVILPGAAAHQMVEEQGAFKN